MTLPNNRPHQNALRKGRFSEPNSRYFITFCCSENSPILATPQAHQAFVETLDQMKEERIVSEVSYCLMPDHAHMVFRLGEALSLGRTVARLKAKVKQTTQPNSITWQSGYYDRKLRKDEELHPILHYIYLNPYRADLLETSDTWPFTRISEVDWVWFKSLLDKSCPYPEWLTNSIATKVAPTS